MEKGHMYNIKTIVLTGAESVGKSILSKGLAKHYNTCYVEEFARAYVEKIQNKYTYADVEYIAQQQIINKERSIKMANGYLFVDTYLVIVKYWFLEVFGKCPDWVETKLGAHDIDLYLLCDLDIPWIADPVRENGGEKRIYLQNCYIRELESKNIPYRMVSGAGEQRLQNAISIVDAYFDDKKIK
jgi:nicotinamide riboside kinase